jgi:hypothetical protein
LLLDEGQPWSAIKQELRCDSRFISTWGGRFVQARLGGLFARHSGRAPTRDPARLEARVLERTLKHKPRDRLHALEQQEALSSRRAPAPVRAALRARARELGQTRRRR